MEYLVLEETDSTNSYISRNFATMPDKTMVRCRKQTAGRGQRGNSWESEEGKNLTFSVLYFPDRFPAHSQFSISETVALAIVETLFESGIDAEVKWPNDIYVGDRKICGILIEHSVAGMELTRTIIGAGINVNQEIFLSDAPNPVSMKNITGLEYDIDTLARKVGENIERALDTVCAEEGRILRHEEFIHNLWRGDGGFYPFRDKESGEEFLARIAGIEPQGWLHLEEEAGRCRRYAFKEVEFLLR